MERARRAGIEPLPRILDPAGNPTIFVRDPKTGKGMAYNSQKAPDGKNIYPPPQASWQLKISIAIQRATEAVVGKEKKHVTPVVAGWLGAAFLSFCSRPRLEQFPNNMGATQQRRSVWNKFVADHRWLVVGSAVFMVGALFFCLGILDWLHIAGLDERFQQRGRTVQGTVFSKTMTSSTSGGILRHRSSSPNYFVTYDSRLRKVKSSKAPPASTRKRGTPWPQEGPVQITYLPNEPLTNRIDGRTDLGEAAVRLIMGALLAVGGGALVFWEMRRFPRVRRLQRAD
jgi:hypothetical protein